MKSLFQKVGIACVGRKSKFEEMKALIIDDESKARSLLEAILKQKCPEITEIILASDLPSGVKLIKKIEPQIILSRH